MKIRAAKTKDINDLTDLLKQLFSIEEDFIFDGVKQKKGLGLLLDSDNARILVAEESGAVIGMVTGQLVISTAEGELSLLIEDMIVNRQQRGKGVGRKLLQVMADWANERGAHRMQVLADLNNHRAFSFYERAEWDRTSLVCLRKYNKDNSK